MSDDRPKAEGLSIRLVPDTARRGCWSLLIRNDGQSTFKQILLRVAEGGIPCPGDLGSTILYSHPLEQLGPDEEFRFGSFAFAPGAEYLDLPLAATLAVEDHALLRFHVTTEDFDRLESLRAANIDTDPTGASLALWMEDYFESLGFLPKRGHRRSE